MENKLAESNACIKVGDVLRGLVVMGIIVLHSIEHFWHRWASSSVR